MRVLVSASTFPLSLDDGLPRFVYDLCEALTAHCEVTALAPGAPGAPGRERMGNVDVRRFSYFWPRRRQALAYGQGMPDNFKASTVAKLQPLPFLWCQTRALRTIVRDEQVDIVNSHWALPQGLSGALARGRSGRFRHAVTLQGGDAQLLRALPFRRSLASSIRKGTDAFVTVSGSVRNDLDEALGSPTDAFVQPNGVHVSRFRAAENIEPVPSPFPNGYVLYFGRLTEFKGVSYLLRAMRILRERRPGVGLLVVGYGRLEQRLKVEVEELGVGDSVRFEGRQPHDRIVRYLAGCRAVAVPSIVHGRSRTEGMPTVVLEAMAAGARVVASSVAGIPEVVRHGENGWLTRQRDPEDIAEKLTMALSGSEGARISREAVRTAERHDWGRVAERYAGLFDELIRGERGGAAARSH